MLSSTDVDHTQIHYIYALYIYIYTTYMHYTTDLVVAYDRAVGEGHRLGRRVEFIGCLIVSICYTYYIYVNIHI